MRMVVSPPSSSMPTSKLDHASLVRFIMEIFNHLVRETTLESDTGSETTAITHAAVMQFFVACGGALEENEEKRRIISDLTSQIIRVDAGSQNNDPVLQDQVGSLKDELTQARQQINDLQGDLKLQEKSCLKLERENAFLKKENMQMNDRLKTLGQLLIPHRVATSEPPHVHDTVAQSGTPITVLQRPQNSSSASILAGSRNPCTRKRGIADLEEDSDDDDYCTVVAGHSSTLSNSGVQLRVIESTFNASNIPPVDVMKLFNRSDLRQSLGGNKTDIVRLSKARKPLAIDLGVYSFLCLLNTLNPWCPAAPGQSGFIFVGFGLESDCFDQKEPKKYPLFIGNGHGTGTGHYGEFMYFGTYAAKRVDGLSVQEWKSLSRGTRQGLIEMTHTKGRHISLQELKCMGGYPQSSRKPFRPKKSSFDQKSRCMEDIEDDYDAGLLTIPCVQLTYLQFDHELYEALEPAPIISPPMRTSSRKRRRTYHND